MNSSGWYSLGELDDRLRQNKLELGDALPIWAREVGGHIEQKWGARWQRFGQVVLSGGGAILLREHLLKQFNGKSYVPEEPVLATARGLYKLAVMQQRRREG